MNNPSPNPGPNPTPLMPQFPMLDQKNRSRARVRLFVFFVISIHVVGLMALLMQGCRKQEPVEPAPDTNTVVTPTLDTNLPPDTTLSASNSVAPPLNMAVPPVAPAGQEYTVERGDSFYSI